MRRTRGPAAVAIGLALLCLGCVSGFAAVPYMQRWVGSDRVLDSLNLPQLGQVAHREHNDFLSADIAPNTTADLTSMPGEQFKDLRTAVALRLKSLGFSPGDSAPTGGYMEWINPGGDAYADLVVVSLPRVGSQVGSDTNPAHRVESPTIRFQVFSG